MGDNLCHLSAFNFISLTYSDSVSSFWVKCLELNIDWHGGRACSKRALSKNSLHCLTAGGNRGQVLDAFIHVGNCS